LVKLEEDKISELPIGFILKTNEDAENFEQSIWLNYF